MMQGAGCRVSWPAIYRRSDEIPDTRYQVPGTMMRIMTGECDIKINVKMLLTIDITAV